MSLTIDVRKSDGMRLSVLALNLLWLYLDLQIRQWGHELRSIKFGVNSRIGLGNN